VDHMLNEQTRARELAADLVSGQASGENPYAMAMTAMIIRDDPRAGVSMVNGAFMGMYPYAFAKTTYTTAFRFSHFMRVGHANWRGTATHDSDVRLPMPAGSEPFFRALGPAAEGGASVNAGVPTSQTGSGK